MLIYCTNTLYYHPVLCPHILAKGAEDKIIQDIFQEVNIDSQSDRQSDSHPASQSDRQSDSQPASQSDRQSDSQPASQSDRQTGRHTIGDTAIEGGDSVLGGEVISSFFRRAALFSALIWNALFYSVVAVCAVISILLSFLLPSYLISHFCKLSTPLYVSHSA